MKVNERNFFKDARGFSVIEILFVLVIVMVVTGLALLGATRAKSNIQMTAATELVKGYIERAVTDARRRHAAGSERSQLVVTSATTFTATLDFAGDGAQETRTITLPSGIRFDYDSSNPARATLDWRGMVAEGAVNFRLTSRDGDSIDLRLSNVGDASINSQFSYPDITVTTTSTDVRASTVVNGNAAPNPNASPTAYPTPLPTCTSGQVALTTPCRCQTGKSVDPNDGKCK